MASSMAIINSEEQVNKSVDECELIKAKIDKHFNKISDHKKKIKSSGDKIKKLKKELYWTCQHKFERDPSAAYDDLFKYKCSKCHLYQNYYN